MQGIQLCSLTEELHKVDQKWATTPIDTIPDANERLEPQEYFDSRDVFSFARDYHRFPLEVFKRFSFEELCKLKYSTTWTMHESIGKLFDTSAQHEIIKKIMSSMWRWGVGRGTWNEVVDAYNDIRHFTFIDDPRFQIRLDHTTSYNEVGRTKYSRTFIDGVFAFLVYHKEVHVMTIGFSIMEDRRVLIQQVQSTKRSGNRFLYRLPRNRVEFVIDLFHKNFPGYTLYVIDGANLVKKTLSGYHHALEDARARCKRYRDTIARSSEGRDFYVRLLSEREEECEMLTTCIAHLSADRERLISFYKDGGRFPIGPAHRTVNGLKHLLVDL